MDLQDSRFKVVYLIRHPTNIKSNAWCPACFGFQDDVRQIILAGASLKKDPQLHKSYSEIHYLESNPDYELEVRALIYQKRTLFQPPAVQFEFLSLISYVYRLLFGADQILSVRLAEDLDRETALDTLLRISRAFLYQHKFIKVRSVEYQLEPDQFEKSNSS